MAPLVDCRVPPVEARIGRGQGDCSGLRPVRPGHEDAPFCCSRRRVLAGSSAGGRPCRHRRGRRVRSLPPLPPPVQYLRAPLCVSRIPKVQHQILTRSRFRSLAIGAAVRLWGKWVPSPGASQSHEMQVTWVEILGPSDAKVSQFAYSAALPPCSAYWE